MKELKLINVNGKYFANSRDVADMVKKDHSNLMRDIRGYISVLAEPDSKLNPADFFTEDTYIDEQNQTRPCFLLTRIGCDMVANKMTGRKGILFTAAYVSKFEEMERQLKANNTPSYMIEDKIMRAQAWIIEQKEVQLLEVKIKEYSEKANYVDTILQSKGAVTTTQIAKDYGLSASALNEILHKAGVQFKQNKQWLLYQKYANKGYTKSHTLDLVRSNGDVIMNTRWTQEGRLFIHKILTDLGYTANVDKDFKDVK